MQLRTWRQGMLQVGPAWGLRMTASVRPALLDGTRSTRHRQANPSRQLQIQGSFWPKIEFISHHALPSRVLAHVAFLRMPDCVDKRHTWNRPDNVKFWGWPRHPGSEGGAWGTFEVLRRHKIGGLGGVLGCERYGRQSHASHSPVSAQRWQPLENDQIIKKRDNSNSSTN